MDRVATLILLMVLAGCAPQAFGPENFHKPRMSVEQRAKDFKNCFYDAYGITPGSKNYNKAKYRHRSASQCMNGRGYLRRDCRQCPPSPYLTAQPSTDDRWDSRQRFTESMARFDKCLAQAVDKLTALSQPPDRETTAKFALDMCKSEQAEAELAVMDSVQTTRGRMRRKGNADIATAVLDSDL